MQKYEDRLMSPYSRKITTSSFDFSETASLEGFLVCTYKSVWHD